MSKSDNTSYKKPISTDFSDGFYDWSIFIINLYLRVQQILKIDYESFMILQIVVGYHVSNLNKTGSSSISQLTFRFEEIVNETLNKLEKLGAIKYEIQNGEKVFQNTPRTESTK